MIIVKKMLKHAIFLENREDGEVASSDCLVEKKSLPFLVVVFTNVRIEAFYRV